MEGGGSGSSESSTVEQETPINHHPNHHEYEGCDESSELELGLGLSLGSTINNSKQQQQIPRILTAKDLTRNTSNSGVRGRLLSPPSSASSSSSLALTTPGIPTTNTNNISGVTADNVSAGTKRAASPTALSQVVGWPPIRSYRINSMASQTKSIAIGELNSEFDENKCAEKKATVGTNDRLPHKSSLFVKVNMDGVTIGRKVDLNVHSCYESLALTLEEMFANRAVDKSSAEELILMPKLTTTSKLLDGTSDFVLTYEDKDGDWMLVGDVPWGMFLSSVKRLRIMRTPEANGLASRSEERSAKQRSRPI